ncbi:hypothetical protein BDY19DRAFT_668979 [Irpex rosettiformis]|uniref:Uncharacterized protein n=1 Tax=Irpex rosettiformis TaxID=378272 RepID=A0ACB8U9X9_9APHY|nr:hypothetical protein BDY19DRAFT_668979 [Irpex rosettiformis]
MISTMATVAFRNSSLCEFCHAKPKYGGHPFCGKTCATQAAGMCIHCYQKPKFGNYDYCGKNCAAQAQAQQPATKPQTKTQAQNAPAANQQTVPLNIVKQAVNAVKKPQKPTAGVMRQTPARGQTQHQPTGQTNQAPLSQWVHMAAAQVPNILSGLNPPQPHASPPPPPPPQPQSSAPLTSSKSYNVPPTKQVNFAATSNLKSSRSHTQPQHQYQHASIAVDPQAQAVSPTVLEYPDSPAVCQIPGCEEYAHVDANGDVSEYCSQAHREEAVDKGLVDPCIKCLIMPQSKTDYFCGRTCREEALHKGLTLPA